MRKKNLGSSDLTVSRICLGTMTFGEQNSEADVHSRLDYAPVHGINFVDTAEFILSWHGQRLRAQPSSMSAPEITNPA